MPVKRGAQVCALCGSSARRVITGYIREWDKRILVNGRWQSNRRRVFECRRCGLIFLERREADAQIRDFYAKNYAGHYVLQNKTNSERLARMRPYLSKSTRLLEVGCSDGQFLVMARRFVKSVTGIELKKEDVLHARRRHRLEVYDTPVEATAFRHKFDVICCFQTLEHVPEPNEFLKTLRGLLAPGGIFFIEVPGGNDALMRLYRIPGHGGFFYHEQHLFVYTPKTLRRMLVKNGFSCALQPLQSYSLTNHLHWIYCNRPQKDTRTGYSVSLPCGTPAAVKLFGELDGIYRKRLLEMGFADGLWARAASAGRRR